MKILYFAPHQLWPLVTGNRLRDYHLARELAQRCSVTFMETLHPGDERGTAAPAAAGFDRVVTVEKEPNFTPGKVLRGLIGPVPVTVLNYFSRRIASTLAEILRAGAFDAVQLESVQLSMYIPIIRAAPSRPLILADWHNIESELMSRYAATTTSLPRRLVARRTALLLEQTEQRLLAECDSHTTASERERQRLLGRDPGAVVHVIPNGVDTSYYSPTLARASTIAEADVSARRSLLFVGSMDYHANITGIEWFTREVWPGISARNSALDFVIAGRNPGQNIRSLASDRIRVTGTIDDVRPLYYNAAAVVVPLHVGSGTRLKILEAMAAGVPVISTALGAEGIDCQHDVHLLIADTAEQMIGSIERILSSGEVRRRLVESARRLVMNQYDWSVIGAKLHANHEKLVQSRRTQNQPDRT